MKELSIFWAIPFPMIIHYGGFSYNFGSSPQSALIWLGVSVILWIIFLFFLFKAIVVSRYIVRRNLANLMENGEVKTCTIEQCFQVQSEVKDINKYQLTLAFDNFAGTPIRETLFINDIHPERNSYVVGKTLKLRIDKTLQNNPYIQIDGAHYNAPKAKSIIILFLIWALFFAIIVWCYIFSYEKENNGMGWSFMQFSHPLILCALILNIFFILFKGLSKKTKNQLQHKYYGIKTTANIISATQTGLYINNQPQVRFELQFTDKNNRVCNANYKKIIDLLNVGITQQKTVDIYYLPEYPTNVCLASDVE